MESLFSEISGSLSDSKFMESSFFVDVMPTGPHRRGTQKKDIPSLTTTEIVGQTRELAAKLKTISDALNTQCQSAFEKAMEGTK
jgi:hypothetical protein